KRLVRGFESGSEPGSGLPFVVVQERAELPDAGVAVQEHALAVGDPAAPGVHRQGEHLHHPHRFAFRRLGRCDVPGPDASRSRDRRAARSGFPDPSSGNRATTATMVGAHSRGWDRLTKSRTALVVGTRSGSETPRTAPTRSPHSGSGTETTAHASTPGIASIRRCTAGSGTFTPPEIATSSTRPSTSSRPLV